VTVDLILGGGGFIGRHVGLALAKRGHRVRLAGRSPISPIDDRLTDDLTYERLDLCTADWDRVLDRVDVVHHYAWSSIPETANNDPVNDLRTNVQGTLQLLEAMRRRRRGRLVFTSSGGTVYGRIGALPVIEEHALDPISLYGAAKVAVEQYLGVYRYAHGIDCRIARLSNPFGIGQRVEGNQGAATIFMHRALAGQPIRIYGDGEIVRDYIHISDAVRGLLALSSAELGPDSPFVYNLASGQGTSLNTIVSVLATRLGREIAVEHLPGRDYDVPISVLNVDRAWRELKWAPRLNFADGLQQELNNYASGARIVSTPLPGDA
jgi:UDP-glucose 4-epimerase